MSHPSLLNMFQVWIGPIPTTPAFPMMVNWSMHFQKLHLTQKRCTNCWSPTRKHFIGLKIEFAFSLNF